MERDRFSITLDAAYLGPSQFVIGILMSIAQDLLILTLGVFWEIDRQERRRVVQKRRRAVRNAGGDGNGPRSTQAQEAQADAPDETPAQARTPDDGLATATRRRPSGAGRR